MQVRPTKKHIACETDACYKFWTRHTTTGMQTEEKGASSDIAPGKVRADTGVFAADVAAGVKAVKVVESSIAEILKRE